MIATVRNIATATQLHSLARSSPNISIEPLDVAQRAQAQALAQRLAGQPIDILLHNAGIAPGTAQQSTFGSLDYDIARQALETNVWAVLWLTEALIGNITTSQQRKVIVLSSAVGSIGSVARFSGMAGGSYMYRISKAALNMAMSLVARDLADRGVIVGLVSPGQVDTDLGGGHRARRHCR